MMLIASKPERDCVLQRVPLWRVGSAAQDIPSRADLSQLPLSAQSNNLCVKGIVTLKLFSAPFSCCRIKTSSHKAPEKKNQRLVKYLRFISLNETFLKAPGVGRSSS